MQIESDKQEEILEYKVSVIIPVYNAAKYIRQGLESVLCQTLEHIEIIVIDDGSTDDTWFKIQDIIAKHPHKLSSIVTIRRENRGVSYSRAEGLALAKGKYVIQFDSDDVMHINMIEDMYYAIENTCADILISDYYLMQVGVSKYVKQEPCNTARESIKQLLLGRNEGFTWNKLIRRELLLKRNITFNTGIGYLEDVLFIIEVLLNARKISFLDKAYYFYRRDNLESITSRIDKDKISKMQTAVNEIENLLKRSAFSGFIVNELNEFKLQQKVWFISANKMEVDNAIWDLFPESNANILAANIKIYYKLALIFDFLKMRYFSNFIINIVGLIQRKVKR